MNQELIGMYFLYGLIGLLILGILYLVIRYFFFPQKEQIKPMVKKQNGIVYEVIKQGDGTWIKKNRKKS